MDLSASMDYTYEQELTKFEYAISLAAALAHLMIKQSDSVGLVTFGKGLGATVPPSSRRNQLGKILGTLAHLKPTGTTDIAHSMGQLASLVRHKSLLILFSDLLAEPDAVIPEMHRLSHRGHDVILFHVLDAAEALFPFHGMVDFEDRESDQHLVADADGLRQDYLEALAEFQERYRVECSRSGVDYAPLHTGMPFDRALVEYLQGRSRRI
jgi:uncharacterized protein (DUF58 family)